MKETYRTLGDAEIYGAGTRFAETAGACCSPRAAAAKANMPETAEKRC